MKVLEENTLFLKKQNPGKAKTFLCVAYNSKDIKGKWSKFITRTNLLPKIGLWKAQASVGLILKRMSHLDHWKGLDLPYLESQPLISITSISSQMPNTIINN